MKLCQTAGSQEGGAVPPSVLDAEIDLLGHGRKRSAGATELYRRYRFSVSRRELGQMVAQVRQDRVADHRRNLRRIQWQTAGLSGRWMAGI